MRRIAPPKAEIMREWYELAKGRDKFHFAGHDTEDGGFDLEYTFEMFQSSPLANAGIEVMLAHISSLTAKQGSAGFEEWWNSGFYERKLPATEPAFELARQAWQAATAAAALTAKGSAGLVSPEQRKEIGAIADEIACSAVEGSTELIKLSNRIHKAITDAVQAATAAAATREAEAVGTAWKVFKKAALKIASDVYNDVLTGSLEEAFGLMDMPTAAIEAASRREREIERLRELLWLNHGQYTPYVHNHYGDDGEMQCCGIDFKRWSVKQIEEHLSLRAAAHGGQAKKGG